MYAKIMTIKDRQLSFSNFQIVGRFFALITARSVGRGGLLDRYSGARRRNRETGNASRRRLQFPSGRINSSIIISGNGKATAQSGDEQFDSQRKPIT